MGFTQDIDNYKLLVLIEPICLYSDVNPPTETVNYNQSCVHPFVCLLLSIYLDTFSLGTGGEK